MGGARKFSVLLLALVCAAALAACGSSGSSTTTTAESTIQATTGSAEGGEGSGSKESKKGGGTGGGKSSQQGAGSGGEAGLERSAEFRTPGGDNSIQDFGDEGDSSDRSEATAIVHALFKGLETGQWGEVCGKYLAASNLEQLKMLSEKSPQMKGKGCAEVLGGLATSGARANSPDAPDGDVVSLRIEGEVAFAIYRGVDGKGYAVPLKLEGGSYKLTALAPTPLNS